MPVGGRINRRENLRSKKAVTKTQDSKDINSTCKISKTDEKELCDTKIIEPPSNANDGSINIEKSNHITKGIGNIYIYLEDLKYSNKTIIDKFLIENVENNELDKVSVAEDKEIKRSSRKTKTFGRILLDPTINYIDENLEEPKKENLRVKKEIDDEDLRNKDKSDLVDKTKKVGKRVGLYKRKCKGAAQTDNSSLDSLSVDTKTDSPKKLKEVIKATPKKNDKISKKEKNDIIDNVTEIFLDDIATKVKLRKRNATLEKSVEASNLSKVVAKDERELIPRNNISNDIQDTQQKNNLMNTPLKAKEESAPTKLGRRNAFQKKLGKKLESVNVTLQNDNVDAELIAENADKDSKENASTDSSIPILTSMEQSQVELPPKSEILSRRAKKHEVAVSKIPEPINAIDDVVSNRLDAIKRPFVVERDESVTVKEKPQDVSKIPGLVMLDNIKKRKSMMIDAKPMIVKDKDVQQKPNEYANENGEEIEKEKSANKTKQSIVRRKIVKAGECGDSEDKVKVPDMNQQSSGEIPEIEKAVAPEGRKKTPGRPKKAVVRETVLSNVEEKIPGLKMIADIRRRKSEMLAASNNLNQLASKTTIRKSIAHVVKESVPDPTDKISKQDAKEERSTRHIVRTPSFAAENKPVAIGSQREDQKMGNIDNVPKCSEKVPGFATIQELKEIKANRSSIHLTNLEKTPEKPTKSEKPLPGKRPMNSDKVPGLSTTNKLKRQNQTQEQESRGYNGNTDKVSNAQPVPMECSSTVPANVPVFSNMLPSTPLSAKFQSMRGYKPRASILSKPSPFKRSMLDQGSDVVGTAAKMARFQIERRQSVTFNKEVEVKEIHGNSFNSTTEDGSVTETMDSANILEQQITSELERTKNRLAEIRSRNANVSFSNSAHTSLGPSVFPKPNVRAVTKKHSDLSKLISARIKEQASSSPSTFSHVSAAPSQSSALRKLAALPTSSTFREVPQDWRSFKPDPVAASINDSAEESVNSVDLDTSENGKSGKPKCLIM